MTSAQTFILPPELADRERIAGNLHAFLLKALPGKRLMVTVAPAKKHRSQEQNRYLWGVVYPAILNSGHLQGWSAEDLHEYLLGEIYGKGEQKAKRKETEIYLGDALDFVTHIRNRIRAYVAFGHDLHEYLLGEVYGWEKVEGFGRTRLRAIRRSSAMSTVEFAEYVAQIQQRMAEHGIYIPDPNE